MEVCSLLLLLSSASASLLTIDTTIDLATIAACSDPIALTCQVVRVDPEALIEDTLSLPGGLELIREDEPSVHSVTFTDYSGAEATFSYSGHGVSGEIETDEGAMFSLEPCPEFQGCTCCWRSTWRSSTRSRRLRRSWSLRKSAPSPTQR